MRQVTPGQGISLTAIAKAARAAKDTRAGVSGICRVEDIVLGTQEGVGLAKRLVDSVKAPGPLWPTLSTLACLSLPWPTCLGLL